MRPGPRLLHVGVCGKSADELLSEPRFPRTQEKGPDRQPEPPWAAAPKARLWRLNADRFRSAFKTWRAAGQAHGGCVSLGDLFHVQERNVICRPACWERLSAALRAGGGGGGGGLRGRAAAQAGEGEVRAGGQTHARSAGRLSGVTRGLHRCLRPVPQPGAATDRHHSRVRPGQLRQGACAWSRAVASGDRRHLPRTHRHRRRRTSKETPW